MAFFRNVAELSFEEAGSRFVESASDEQSLFLVSAAKSLSFDWARQCEFIARELTAKRRPAVADMLQTLVDALRKQ